MQIPSGNVVDLSRPWSNNSQVGGAVLQQSAIVGNVGTAQAGIVVPIPYNPDSTNLHPNPTLLLPVGLVGSPSNVARVLPYGNDSFTGSGAPMQERDGNTGDSAGGGAKFTISGSKLMDPDDKAFQWGASMVVGDDGANYFADPTLHPAGGSVDNWVGPGNPNHVLYSTLAAYGFQAGTGWIFGRSMEARVKVSAGTRADTNTLRYDWIRAALQAEDNTPAAAGTQTDRGSPPAGGNHDWSDSYDEATCGSFANPPEGTTSSLSFARIFASICPISTGSATNIQTHTAYYLKPDSAIAAPISGTACIRKEKYAVFPPGTSAASVLAGLAYTDTTTLVGQTLIMVTAKAFNAGDTLVTDPASAGWTLIGAQVDNASGVSMLMWRIFNASARTHAEAIKWNNIRHQAAAFLAFSNVPPTIALDQNTSSTGNSATITSGNFTPGVGAKLAVGAVAALNLSTSVPTHSAPTGWVYLDDSGSTTQQIGAGKGVSVDLTANNANRIRLMVGYMVNPPNAVTHFEANTGASRQYAGIGASFK